VINSYWPIKREWTKDKFFETHKHLKFLIGNIPYGQIFGEQHGIVTLNEYKLYLERMLQAPNYPEQPLYIFDTEIATKDDSLVPKENLLPSNFEIFKNVTKYYQFLLGPENTGAPFHFHCPAANFLVYGTKKWWIYPPSKSFYSKVHPTIWLQQARKLINQDKGQSQQPSTKRSKYNFREGLNDLPFECTQNEGDIFFIPSFWGHSIINLSECIGVAVEFDLGDC